MDRNSNKKVIFFTITVMISVIIACAKTTTTQVNTENTLNTSIQVFYSPPPDHEYTELGIITTQTGQTILHDRSAAGMIEKLKVEAVKMGADAIIVRSVNEGTWGLKGGGNTGFERGNAQAVAIKFKQILDSKLSSNKADNEGRQFVYAKSGVFYLSELIDQIDWENIFDYLKEVQ